MLAASSSDGYITFVTFEKDELGTSVELDSLPEKIKNIYKTYLNCDIKNSINISNNGTNY